MLGIGSSPGKTNLLARQAVDELGGEVDSLDVIAGGRDLDPPDGESFPYALRTLLDEVTLPPVVIRDGEAIEIEPLTSGGEVDFGDPIGTGDTVNTIHSEMLTFPTSFGCTEASFRLSLPPAVEARLRELAGASEGEASQVQRSLASAVAARPSPSTWSTRGSAIAPSGLGRSRRRTVNGASAAGSSRPRRPSPRPRG